MSAGLHSPCIRFVLAVCAVLSSEILPAGVIGADDRRMPEGDEVELVQALGHVVCSKVIEGVRRRSAGTGTVVGSRSTVLTAAHVFTDAAGRRGPEVRFDAVSDCVFRQYDVHANVSVEIAFALAEMGAFRENPLAPDQDWAVLRTVQPVPGSGRGLAFANATDELDSLSGLAIKILAFHADTQAYRRVPLLSEGELLSIRYAGEGRLAHTADMGRMSSGAAIVHRSASGDYVVVGVNRSSANLGDFNLAVPLTFELAAALKSYAFGQVPAHRQRVAGVPSGQIEAQTGARNAPGWQLMFADTQTLHARAIRPDNRDAVAVPVD
jgi:hypothetical protein